MQIKEQDLKTAICPRPLLTGPCLRHNQPRKIYNQSGVIIAAPNPQAIRGPHTRLTFNIWQLYTFHISPPSVYQTDKILSLALFQTNKILHPKKVFGRGGMEGVGHRPPNSAEETKAQIFELHAVKSHHDDDH